MTPYTKKDLGISDSDVVSTFTVCKNTVEFVQHHPGALYVFINDRKLSWEYSRLNSWEDCVEDHKFSLVYVVINRGGC